MITTFSGAAVRSEISDAGKFSLAPVPAPVAGLADVALLGEEREQVVGRRRARRPRPARTAARRSPPRRWASRTWRLSGSRRASSGVPSSRNSGWWMTYWSTGAPEATRTATLVPCRRPARPICCHVAATEPGIAGQDRRRRGGRCRRRARARSSRRRRGSRRRAGRARSRGARSAGSRRGSRGPGDRGPKLSRSDSRRPVSRISTATRDRPKTIVWRPARRNGSAQRWARVTAEPRAPLAGVEDAAGRRAGRAARRPARRCDR